MGIIRLENIRLFGHHGVFPEERKTGSEFVINAEIVMDLEHASHTDRLEDTFDYQMAYTIVLEEMKSEALLLEHLAGRICRRILQSSEKIEQVCVKVDKTNPPFGGDVKAVSVEYTEKRNNEGKA